MERPPPAIRKYDAPVIGRLPDVGQLPAEFRPFERDNPVPPHFEQLMIVVYDQTLVSFLEENREYEKACVLGEKDDPSERDRLKYAGDCDCVWVSQAFRKVCYTYPDFFETRTTKEQNGRPLHFNTFKPAALRSMANKALADAKAYFERCLSILDEKERRDLYEGGPLGLSYEEFMADPDFSEMRPFDKSKLEPVRHMIQAYLRQTDEQYARVRGLH